LNLLIPPPLLGAIAASLMWGVAAAVPGMSFTFAGQAVLAGLMAVTGVAVDLTAIASFMRARTTITPFNPQKARYLVVSGVYAFSRNPMYLGLLILLCGWAVWMGNPLNAAVLAAFVAYLIRFQIQPEEAILTRLFGEPYVAYTRRVRRWI
jgi:protein-S-isoprenylcysteine O-methyltransferase Ste14